MNTLAPRPKTRLLAALGAGAAVLVGTAACGSSSSGAAAASSAASTSPPASSSAGPGGSSSSYPATASATPTATACPTSQLSITASPAQGALSHAGLILKFVNTGQQTCTLTGYPSVVAGAAGASNSVRAQVNRGGYIFHANTPAIVTLRPGGAASAGIEWLAAPTGGQQSCPTFSTITVTPPHDTAAATVHQQVRICSGFEVHAIVPGASGISGPPAP